MKSFFSKGPKAVPAFLVTGVAAVITLCLFFNVLAGIYKDTRAVPGTIPTSEDVGGNIFTDFLYKTVGLDLNDLSSVLRMALPRITEWGEKTDETAESPLEETPETKPLNVIIDEPEPYTAPVARRVISYDNLHELESFGEVLAYLYSIDPKTYITEADLPVTELAEMDMTCDLSGDAPKVLIFHTHSQEAFSNSREGVEEDTIIGIGELLASILRDTYGVATMHHKGKYDLVNGVLERGNSYERMEPEIKKLLSENPTIEVLIDLHRDGLPEDRHLVTEIDGKPTAQIMYFNGISQLNEGGELRELTNLPNSYIKENLALSLQMQLSTNRDYPNLARHIYIRPYRYSLHMSPKSLLIEAGGNTNSVEEVRNLMYPLAKILMDVLQ